MTSTKNIMIVDDDEDDIDFFCEALYEINASYHCLTSANGEEALHKLRHMKVLPECLFLDLNMPRMTGKTCLRELKNDGVLKNIPVIIFTTSSNRKEQEETLRLGASYFLTKPTTYDQMRQEIEEALREVHSKKTKEVSG